MTVGGRGGRERGGGRLRRDREGRGRERKMTGTDAGAAGRST